MIMESPWNAEQNKAFERALALFDEDSGMERWENIANYVPCKSAAEIKRHYEVLMEDIEAIESGLVSPPHYSEASYVPNWLTQQQQQQQTEPTTANSVPCVQPCSKSPCQPSFSVKPTPAPSKAFEQERKKGVPWTEEEHRMFLLGLNKYGKGDWRSISRNFVVSRTPTQVASHAQKYFLRLSSANKEKKRSSIHDITSVGVTEIKQQSPSQQQPQQQQQQQQQQPPLAPVKSLSTTSTAPTQSLGYPTSSLGVSMSNAMGSHQTGSNHMMLPPHTLGLYPTPGDGFENSSRNVSQRASFSLPQMELSPEHDAYYVGNLMSID